MIELRTPASTSGCWVTALGQQVLGRQSSWSVPSSPNDQLSRNLPRPTSHQRRVNRSMSKTLFEEIFVIGEMKVKGEQNKNQKLEAGPVNHGKAPSVNRVSLVSGCSDLGDSWQTQVPHAA